MTPPAETVEEGRHATWLELFFDLMAVAGVAALAHLLHDDASVRGLTTYTVAFTAFWVIWACYTTYGNIKGDAVRTATMLAGMVALGFMTAVVPSIEGGHARVFAIAYIIARLLVTRPWSQTTVVVDLPVVQATVTVVPWIVSLWVAGDARMALWALGLALDVMLLIAAKSDAIIERAQARLDAVRARLERSSARSGRLAARSRAVLEGDERLPVTITAATADAAHLDERMGLFVLIVLGEGLVQIVTTASGVEWNGSLALTALSAFAVLISIWSASVQRGHAGLALVNAGALPMRLAWLSHLVVSGALVMAASTLGSVVARPDEPLESHERWVFLSAMSVWVLLSVAVHALTGGWRVALRIGIPLTLAIAAGAIVGGGVRASSLIAWFALGSLVAFVPAPRRRSTILAGRD